MSKGASSQLEGDPLASELLGLAELLHAVSSAAGETTFERSGSGAKASTWANSSNTVHTMACSSFLRSCAATLSGPSTRATSRVLAHWAAINNLTCLVWSPFSLSETSSNASGSFSQWSTRQCFHSCHGAGTNLPNMYLNTCSQYIYIYIDWIYMSHIE